MDIMNPQEVYFALMGHAALIEGMPIHGKLEAWEEGKLKARSGIARSILQEIGDVSEKSMWALCRAMNEAIAKWMQAEDIPRLCESEFIFAVLGEEAERAAVQSSACDLEELEELSYELELAMFVNRVADCLDEWKEMMNSEN